MRQTLTEETRRRIKEELALRDRYTIKQILRRYQVSRKTLDRLRKADSSRAAALQK